MSASVVQARFVGRPNRFRVRAAVGRGLVDAFLPNPGRLRELLLPGSPVRLVRKPRPGRQTQFDVLAVRRAGEWVCLDTRLPNAAVADCLAARGLPEFATYRTFRAEAAWRDSRFDFLLEHPGRCWLEVKCCSLVVRGRALFPDAPTVRGTRHLDGLARLARSGASAAVLFVVVRRAGSLAPNDATDPDFGDALRRAHGAGVQVIARRASLRGARLVLRDPVPVEL